MNFTKNMSKFQIAISYYAPYPKENKYDIDTWEFSTAVGKALRKWRQDNKGKKIKELTIKAIKL